MAIDPKLLIIKPVSQLQNEPSPLNAKVLMYNGGGELKTTPLDDLKSLISSGVKGVLKISDAKPSPSAVGKYDLSEVGTYTNLVPIIAVGSSTPSNTPITTLATDLNSVYWDGINFIQFKKAIPQATQSIVAFSTSAFPLVAPAPPSPPIQRTHENTIYQLADGQTSTITDVPSVSPKWIAIGKKTATTFSSTNNTDAQGGKQIADAYSDVKIFAGSNVAELLKMSTSISANVSAGFMKSDGVFAGHSNFFSTGFIKIEDASFTYTTQLQTQFAAVCVYDENKVFIEGKNQSQLTNTSVGYVERLLSTDFDLTTAKYVRISCYNSATLIIKYAVNLLVDNTIQQLNYGSKKAISSEAIKPIEAEIDNLEIVINSQSNSIELLKKEIEDLTIKQQPLYLEMATSFMKGFSGNIAIAKTFNIVSRDGDYQFTTTLSELTDFTVNNSTLQIVVKTPEGRHIPIRGSLNNVTGVVTTYDALPTSFSQWVLVWGDDIHLSRWGYLAMAEWFVESCLLKNILRKKKIFGVYSRACDASQFDWKIGGVVKLATQTIGSPLPGTGWTEDGISYVGGWGISGRISATRLESKYTHDWVSSQKTKDLGFKFTFPAGRAKGFVRLVYGISVGSKNPIKLNFKDQNGNIFYTETTLKKGLNELIVNVTKEISTVTIEAIWTLDGVTTKFVINDIELFETYQESTQVFKTGDIIAYYMDSWGGYPLLQAGETSATRPDGSAVGGLAFFANRVKSYLIEKGITTEFYLIGRGGMTSAWGNYWVDKALDICPKKPDYLVTNFWINDSNSIANNASWQFGTGGTPYNDVAPLVSSYTTPETWLTNMKGIAEKSLKRGIQPIIIGYPQHRLVKDAYEQRDVILLNQDKFLA